jgi:hypothetical protein
MMCGRWQGTSPRKDVGKKNEMITSLEVYSDKNEEV